MSSRTSNTRADCPATTHGAARATGQTPAAGLVLATTSQQATPATSTAPTGAGLDAASDPPGSSQQTTPARITPGASAPASTPRPTASANASSRCGWPAQAEPGGRTRREPAQGRYAHRATHADQAGGHHTGRAELQPDRGHRARTARPRGQPRRPGRQRHDLTTGDSRRDVPRRWVVHHRAHPPPPFARTSFTALAELALPAPLRVLAVAVVGG